MIARLALLLLMLVPVLEIVVLVWIARETSVLTAFALVIGAGVLGAALARYQGVQCLRRISADLEQGKMPAEPLFDGLLILLAALLMIIPGLLSDVVAIGLLFPPTRKSLKSLMRGRLRSRMMVMHRQAVATADERDQIIDVKVVESSPDKRTQ